MLKEMLFTLDLAVDTGTDADRAAADRLQRKCGSQHSAASALPGT